MSKTDKTRPWWVRIADAPLSAQARYAAGTREILECWLEGRPIRDEYLIISGGGLAGTGAHSYKL
jgi:formate dehydrogenase